MKRHKTLRQFNPTVPQGASNNLPAKYCTWRKKQQLLNIPVGAGGKNSDHSKLDYYFYYYRYDYYYDFF